MCRQEQHANHIGHVHEAKGNRVGVQNDKVYLEQATRLLDRVQVMRVFDFAGVVEAMGEVGRICDTKNDRPQQNETYEAGDQVRGEDDEVEQEGIRRVLENSQDDEVEQDGIKRVVEDSQDESSDLSDSPPSKKSTDMEILKENSELQATRMRMIVLDSIAPVVNAIILKDQTQGLPPPRPNSLPLLNIHL